MLRKSLIAMKCAVELVRSNFSFRIFHIILALPRALQMNGWMVGETLEKMRPATLRLTVFHLRISF